ncbi:hypothetical protein [Mesorhizobium sp. Z1-4]|uniref:hypothetical protein n=1 Tax=Mesorhizobium sp. Z1-4 TaxID=2448478 RepID=UPI000FDC4C02|nr:hypothetical protein [Mesorhizobium sp. Z1-4]
MPSDNQFKSDEEIETFLHDKMREIVNVKAETPLGHKALRLALTGPYGALMHMEREKPVTAPDDP